MAKHRIQLDLRHGSILVGCAERHGDDSQSIVSFVSFGVLQKSSSANKQSSFQEVQDLPAIQAALRFLPNIIIGIILNLGTGLLVHRLHANYLVVVSSVLSAGSPLLMAIIDPEWSWWYCAFWAVLLGPLSADGEYLLSCFGMLLLLMDC